MVRDSKGRFVKGNKSNIGRVCSEETKRKIGLKNSANMKRYMDTHKNVALERVKLMSSPEPRMRMGQTISRLWKEGRFVKSTKTQFKKGDKPWNKMDGKIKRVKQSVRVGKKIIPKSHYVWFSQPGNLPYLHKGFVIHHIDLNPNNNSPENLIMLPDNYHKKAHTLIIKKIKEDKNGP